jgi:hypothetical protein
MKQTKIDLLEPFEKVVEAVLSTPESHQVIVEGAVQMPQAQFANRVNRSPASEAELKEVLRCLYEAAHGRQVETKVGAVAIAPPVAAVLKESHFYVRTQVGFLLEALTRIISAASHSNNGIPPPQIGKRDVLNNGSITERKNDDEKIAMQSAPFLRSKRPAFLENRW